MRAWTSSCLDALQGKTPPPAEKKKEEVDKPAAQANGKVGFSTTPVCAGVTAQDLVMCLQPSCCSPGQRHGGCAAARVEHVVSGMLVTGCRCGAEPRSRPVCCACSHPAAAQASSKVRLCRQCCQGWALRGVHSCCAALAVHVLVLGMARLDNWPGHLLYVTSDSLRSMLLKLETQPVGAAMWQALAAAGCLHGMTASVSAGKLALHAGLPSNRCQLQPVVSMSALVHAGQNPSP